MTLYTPAIKALVKAQVPPYRGLIFDIAEYDEQYLTLRLYRDNFEMFPKTQRVGISLWVGEVIQNIRTAGVPCYLEVFEYVPIRP